MLLWWLVPLLRRGLLDQPNARSSHAIPTPRGGGLAFVVVGSGAVALHGGELPLLCLPLALVGLLDDRLNLPAGLRYGVQLATALVLVLSSPWIPQSASTLPAVLVAVIALVLAIAATAVINFTNFMDGLDGLVAGCLAVVVAAAAMSEANGGIYWPLVGALLGFLLWNWSPAKVFMGDVGSTFLGALLAGLVLREATGAEALGLLLVATPLMADACLCVLRRLLAGEHVLEAHRLHVFQRLHQAGMPHAAVASLYIGATAGLAAALLLGGWPWVLALAAVVVLIGIWLDQRIAIPFAQALRSPEG